MLTSEIKALVERGKKLGLIHTPRTSPSKQSIHKVTGHEAAAMDGVRVSFMCITPDLAKSWLECNQGNRHLRRSVVTAYERDMRNGDWLLNHQGIAFDSTGRLIDGQHRLQAICNAGVTVTMLVSTGWPQRQSSARNTTMDTFDRGLNRSVADQLGLQHGMTDARYAVSYATVVAKLCRGLQQSLKMSTALTLAVCEQFSDGLKFSVENRNNLQGLRTCGVLGAVAFSFAVFPHKVPEFYEALVSGAGLGKNHPVLPLRNWLTVGEGAKYITGSAHFYQASVVLNHIQRFCLDQTAEQICTSQDGLAYFTKCQNGKVEAVNKLLQ
jgi:hypothetical protein